MSKDFKTKYFEKFHDLGPDFSLFDEGYRIAHKDLFPIINEMREALETYKKIHGPLSSGERALKNLDDFVGGGE